MDTLAYLYLLEQHEAGDRPSVKLPWLNATARRTLRHFLWGGVMTAALMTASAASALTGYVITSGDRLQVEARSGPGIDFEVDRILYEGDAVELTGTIQNGWSQLADGSWLPVEQVRPSVVPNPQPSPPTPPTESPEPTEPTPPAEPDPSPPTQTWGKVAQVEAYGYRLNARWGPGTRYGVARTLGPNEQIRLSGRVDSNGWVQLIDGTWVAGNLIEPAYGGFERGGNVGGDVGSDRLNATVSAYGYNLNVRSGPGTSYSIVRVLSDGQALEISGRYRNGWAELSDGNWVAGNLIRLTQTTPSPVEPAPPTDAIPVLRFGSAGPRVIRLQNRLKELNYLAATQASDGVYGSTTEQAVIEFQRVQGLPVDGVAGTTTLDALYAANAPRKPEPQRTLQPGDRVQLVNDGIGGIAVYDEPFTEGRILSIYASGSEVTVNQINENGWIELSSGGWVRREFIAF
ncbi:peptidoglycan-binding protein [Almyronema epifaneia]|uniref:Peptidoglycan-binding protein n=1 Tax=Almyronema epifaneia S1 TaxID=2991925 RepID=A0ABW6IA02_9CYAN